MDKLPERPEIPKLPPFVNMLSRSQMRIGWCWLVIHAVALPFILSAFAEFAETPMSEGQVNLLYYVISFAFVMLFLGKFLRRSFDVLCDRIVFCLVVMVSGVVVYYALSYLAALILVLAEGGLPEENPNNAAIAGVALRDFGIMRAVSIFIAPIVEEVLFRGVAFGSMRKYSRFSAYVISIALFCIYHVWQYVLVSEDWTLLIYMVQYIAPGFVLARIYERSGSIWPAIFFHMGVNAFSFAYLAQTM